MQDYGRQSAPRVAQATACRDCRSKRPYPLRNSVRCSAIRCRKSLIAEARLAPRSRLGPCSLPVAVSQVVRPRTTLEEEMEGRMRKTLIPAALAILLAPAPLLAQKVSYDYNK